MDQIYTSEPKKQKRNIQFNGVTVFYFPRIQGFTCVPSQGGCTLGMSRQHCDEKSFSLAEHMAEQKRIHRQQMLEKSPRPSSSLSTSSLNSLLINSPILQCNSTMQVTQTPTTNAPVIMSSTQANTDDRSRSSTEESDSEEDILSDNSSSELDTETVGFLQPVSQKQRRALLKAAGVREIASYEKNECRDIRASREFCGCRCRDYCDPESCFCSQSGIKCQVSYSGSNSKELNQIQRKTIDRHICHYSNFKNFSFAFQVDRASFPCGCTENGCGNVFGRVEFNPKRVRTHFIHTIMRLELEKKQKKSDKQNALHTYDGRLRLPESDEDNSVVDSIDMNNQSSRIGRLVSYNPANNILFPTTTALQSNSLMHSIDTHSHYDNASRNCATSLAEPQLDLHYAYRSDYSVDLTPSDSTQPNYPLIYSGSNYYRSTAAAEFDDFTNINPATPTTLLSDAYTNYPATNAYDVSTAPTAASVDNNVSTYITNGANDDCVLLNGSLFESNHTSSDLLSTGSICVINQSATTPQNHDKTTVEQLRAKYDDYDSNKILDVSANDLNSLLGDDNLQTQHISNQVPSHGSIHQNPSENVNQSNGDETYTKFESDYANKLSAVHNYGVPNGSQSNTMENRRCANDESNELFQKDSVLTN